MLGLDRSMSDPNPSPSRDPEPNPDPGPYPSLTLALTLTLTLTLTLNSEPGAEAKRCTAACPATPEAEPALAWRKRWDADLTAFNAVAGPGRDLARATQFIGPNARLCHPVHPCHPVYSTAFMWDVY